MQNKFADVIINITHENVDRPFTYAVPEELSDRVYPGCPVLVPFGNGNATRTGYVTELKETTDVEAARVKPLLGIAEKDVSPVRDLMALAAWMHDHYGCMMNQALKTVLPVRMKVRERKSGSPAADTGVFSSVPEEKLVLNDEQKRAAGIFRESWKRAETGPTCCSASRAAAKRKCIWR